MALSISELSNFTNRSIPDDWAEVNMFVAGITSVSDKFLSLAANSLRCFAVFLGDHEEYKCLFLLTLLTVYELISFFPPHLEACR